VQSDHEIDPKVTVASNGKTIGFCCKDCIPTFEKDPAKYLATLK
jgi:YHS domain-containing protein